MKDYRTPVIEVELFEEWDDIVCNSPGDDDEDFVTGWYRPEEEDE